MAWQVQSRDEPLEARLDEMTVTLAEIARDILYIRERLDKEGR
jgi:hypothetical protein